jgi:hypothetical protein
VDIMDGYKGNTPKRNKEATMVIYKEWFLKNYLGFFKPGYYEYIMSCLEGTKVTVLPNCLASAHAHDYKMQGKIEHHHGIVPLWKGHDVQVLDKNFVKEYARGGWVLVVKWISSVSTTQQQKTVTHLEGSIMFLFRGVESIRSTRTCLKFSFKLPVYVQKSKMPLPK